MSARPPTPDNTYDQLNPPKLKKEIDFLMRLRDLTSVVDQDAQAVTKNNNKRKTVALDKDKNPTSKSYNKTLQKERNDAAAGAHQTRALPDMAPETTFLY